MKVTTAEAYIKLWTEAEEGSAHYPPHSVYQYITSQYPQMGKSNAMVYTSWKILEILHGWKLNLDNVVWDVPTFIERRQAIHRWDHVLPDEMQRNAGNRSWQTEDNAITGEELETGSFEHKHVVMTIPSKHRLDKLIADVCTSQIVIDRTDAHNQLSYISVYSLARGQLDRYANERTPKLGTLTIGKVPDEIWSDYLSRKRAYFDKRRARNLERAQAILSEATSKKGTSLTVAELEALIMDNPLKTADLRQGKEDQFSFSRVRTFLRDEGYEIAYNKTHEATFNANEHIRLKKEQERAEADA